MKLKPRKKIILDHSSYRWLFLLINNMSHSRLWAIVACVESRWQHHGDLRPASLPVDGQVRSNPSLATRCRWSGREAPTAAVAFLQHGPGAQPTPVWPSVQGSNAHGVAHCPQTNLVRLSIIWYPTTQLRLLYMLFHVVSYLTVHVLKETSSWSMNGFCVGSWRFWEHQWYVYSAVQVPLFQYAELMTTKAATDLC